MALIERVTMSTASLGYHCATRREKIGQRVFPIERPRRALYGADVRLG